MPGAGAVGDAAVSLDDKVAAAPEPGQILDRAPARAWRDGASSPPANARWNVDCGVAIYPRPAIQSASGLSRFGSLSLAATVFAVASAK